MDSSCLCEAFVFAQASPSPAVVVSPMKTWQGSIYIGRYLVLKRCGSLGNSVPDTSLSLLAFEDAVLCDALPGFAQRLSTS